jgi:hypothetical protein
MRRSKRKAVAVALAGGASLALLSMTGVGYAAWSSQLPTVESVSTVAGIPAPTGVSISANGGTYTISWGIPSGTSYGGSPLAQSFEVQGGSSSSGPWETIAIVPGSTTSYSTAATDSIPYYRVVTVDNGWLSSYSGGSFSGSPGSPAPPTTITTYQVETFYNSPPNYCGSHYVCSGDFIPALGSSGLGMYYGSLNLSPYFTTLTSPGQYDGYTYLASWNYYGGQQLYVYYQGSMRAAPSSCVPHGVGCPFPGGVYYFIGGGLSLFQGESILNSGGLTYQPECQSSSNNSSYLNSCVYPYDPSYQPSYQELVPTTTTIN